VDGPAHLTVGSSVTALILYWLCGIRLWRTPEPCQRRGLGISVRFECPSIPFHDVARFRNRLGKELEGCALSVLVFSFSRVMRFVLISRGRTVLYMVTDGGEICIYSFGGSFSPWAPDAGRYAFISLPRTIAASFSNASLSLPQPARPTLVRLPSCHLPFALHGTLASTVFHTTV